MSEKVGRFVRVAPERRGTVRYSRNDGLTVVAEEAMRYVDIEWRREDHWFTEEDCAIIAPTAKMDLGDVYKALRVFNVEQALSWSIPQDFINTKITGGTTIGHLPHLLRYLDEGIAMRDPVKPKETDLPGRLFLLEDAVSTLTQQVQALARQVQTLSESRQSP